MQDTVDGKTMDNFGGKPAFMSAAWLVFSLILFLLAGCFSRFARDWMNETFDTVWILVIGGYVRPLLYLCSGWLFISGLNKIFFSTPFSCKISRRWKIVSKAFWIILVAFLALCFLNILPLAIRLCASSWFHIDLLSVFPWTSFVFSESGSSFLLGKLGGYLYLYLQEENSFIFIFLGILLWYLGLSDSKRVELES